MAIKPKDGIKMDEISEIIAGIIIISLLLAGSLWWTVKLSESQPARQTAVQEQYFNGE